MLSQGETSGGSLNGTLAQLARFPCDIAADILGQNAKALEVTLVGRVLKRVGLIEPKFNDRLREDLKKLRSFLSPRTGESETPLRERAGDGRHLNSQEPG